MRNQKPVGDQHRNEHHNVSMSERDKQKTVANPSPGSSDPGNEGRKQNRRPAGRHTTH